MDENSGTEASDDKITESKRTEYTDATKDAEITKRPNVESLNHTAIAHFKKEGNQPEGYSIGAELHPSEYYQTPTALTAKDYVVMLKEVKAHGDLPDLVDGTLALFKNLEEGEKHAYEFMRQSTIPSHNRVFRRWLAGRVIYQAINYFSRLWREDKDTIERFEQYKTYLTFEARCLKHPYAYLRGIEAMMEEEDE